MATSLWLRKIGRHTLADPDPLRAAPRDHPAPRGVIERAATMGGGSVVAYAAMTIRPALYLIVLGMLTTVAVDARVPDADCTGANVLSPAEKPAGWHLLFDGSSKA